MIGASLLGFCIPALVAARRGRTPAGAAASTSCRGKARRLKPGRVGFSFSCEDEDVTAFVLRANRTLHSVYDPSFAFGCERSTSKSFSCVDIHSGAGPVGSGVATVSEPLCRGAHLTLRITPTLNFETQPRGTFTLRGPC